jgi:hypothetical protein
VGGNYHIERQDDVMTKPTPRVMSTGSSWLRKTNNRNPVGNNNLVHKNRQCSSDWQENERLYQSPKRAKGNNHR